MEGFEDFHYRSPFSLILHSPLLIPILLSVQTSRIIPVFSSSSFGRSTGKINITINLALSKKSLTAGIFIQPLQGKEINSPFSVSHLIPGDIIQLFRPCCQEENSKILTFLMRHLTEGHLENLLFFIKNVSR